MSMDPIELDAQGVLDVLDLAAEWARAEDLDTEEWSEDDFLEYFYNDVEWENVAEVRWRSGGFAGVKVHGGAFLVYDDVDTEGPFPTFEEAYRRLRVDERWEEISAYSANPLFARKP